MNVVDQKPRIVKERFSIGHKIRFGHASVVVQNIVVKRRVPSRHIIENLIHIPVGFCRLDPFRDNLTQAGLTDRLGQVIVHSRFHAFFLVAFHGVGRHSNNRNVFNPAFFDQRADILGRLIAVHHRHLDIHQDNIELAFFRLLHGHLAVLGNTDFKTKIAQHLFRHDPVNAVILHKKNAPAIKQEDAILFVLMDLLRQPFSHNRKHVVFSHRLGQVIRHAGRKTFFPVTLHDIRRQRDNRDILDNAFILHFRQRLACLKTVHNRHLTIHKNQVVGIILLDPVEDLLTIDRNGRFALRPFQKLKHEILVCAIILGQQYLYVIERRVSGRFSGPLGFGTHILVDINQRRRIAQRIAFPNPGHRVDQFFNPDRLRQERREPRIKEATRIPDATGRGQHNQRRIFRLAIIFDLPRQLLAINARHQVIDDSNLVWVALINRIIKPSHRFHTVKTYITAQAGPIQVLVQHIAVHRNIVDNQGPDAAKDFRCCHSLFMHQVFFQDQRERERRADANGTGYINIAAHHLRQLLGNGKPQARSAKTTRRRRIGLRKLVEDQASDILRNTDTGILDRNLQFVKIRIDILILLALFDRNQDITSFRELDGVSDKIGNDLADPARIADNMLRRTGNITDDQLDCFLPRFDSHELGDIVHQHHQVERNRLQLHLAGLDFREIENIIDDVQQSLG